MTPADAPAARPGKGGANGYPSSEFEGGIWIGDSVRFLGYAVFSDVVLLPKRLDQMIHERTAVLSDAVRRRFPASLCDAGNEAPSNHKFTGGVTVWRVGEGAMDVRSATRIERDGFRRDMFIDEAYYANRGAQLSTVIYLLRQQASVVGTYDNGERAIQITYRFCAVDGESRKSRLFTIQGDPPPSILRPSGTLPDGHHDAMQKLASWLKDNVTIRP